jgi:hypothetical protein
MVKLYLSLFLILFSIPSFSQSKLDFVYMDLEGCNKDCRKAIEIDFSSIAQHSDSLFIYVSNGVSPFFTNDKGNALNFIEPILRKQVVSPIFSDDMEQINDALSAINFIDLTVDSKDSIDFHFYFESNRFVKSRKVESFIKEVLLTNNSMDKSHSETKRVIIHLKKFQVDSKYNLDLKNKKNKLKENGYVFRGF